MAVEVVLLAPIMNENPEGVVPLNSVERSPSIYVGMTRMKTRVLHHSSVAVAVVHVDII